MNQMAIPFISITCLEEGTQSKRYFSANARTRVVPCRKTCNMVGVTPDFACSEYVVTLTTGLSSFCACESIASSFKSLEAINVFQKAVEVVVKTSKKS